MIFFKTNEKNDENAIHLHAINKMLLYSSLSVLLYELKKHLYLFLEYFELTNEKKTKSQSQYHSYNVFSD